MSKKVHAKDVLAWSLAVVFLAFLLNYALVYAGFRPFIYCAFSDLLWKLYQPFQTFFVLIALCAFVWGLARKSFTGAASAAAFLILAYALPEWGNVLFSLGKTC